MDQTAKRWGARTLCLSTLLFSSWCFGETFTFELNAEHADLRTRFGGSETELISGRLYLKPVDSGNKPLAESGFLSRNSFVDLGCNRQRTDLERVPLISLPIPSVPFGQAAPNPESERNRCGIDVRLIHPRSNWFFQTGVGTSSGEPGPQATANGEFAQAVVGRYFGVATTIDVRAEWDQYRSSVGTTERPITLGCGVFIVFCPELRLRSSSKEERQTASVHFRHFAEHWIVPTTISASWSYVEDETHGKFAVSVVDRRGRIGRTSVNEFSFTRRQLSGQVLTTFYLTRGLSLSLQASRARSDGMNVDSYGISASWFPWERLFVRGSALRIDPESARRDSEVVSVGLGVRF